MAQRHGEPPARARETLMPASDTHGLADPGRGRAEAPLFGGFDFHACSAERGKRRRVGHEERRRKTAGSRAIKER